MKRVSANEAKARFGQLLDTARREPVAIEKHGRPVAVVLSTEDYEELEAIKLERLRAEIRVGLDEIARGESTELDEAGLRRLAREIKAQGRKSATE
ncbi:MAG: type II toxin-antitoxin system Phd/YefM family antitoxin [Rhodospirillales bacterium]|nr:type II toxin-antitoxin system Phd/YefM family antitoxin [Rhodospirillales bacterium]